MPPHVEVGGGVPKPRKLSAASIAIALPTHNRGDDEDRGQHIRQHPSEHDARGRGADGPRGVDDTCFTTGTAPRTTRDAPGAMTSPIAMMTFGKLCPQHGDDSEREHDAGHRHHRVDAALDVKSQDIV